MTTTVIGTIGDAKSARQLVNELVQAGFKKQDVELLEGSEQEILAQIVERGFDEDDARAAAAGGRTGTRGLTFLERRWNTPAHRLIWRLDLISRRVWIAMGRAEDGCLGSGADGGG